MKSLRRHWLAIVFLLTALPAGWRVALLTPIGQVADEPAHIARAGAVLHGQLLGHKIRFHPAGQPAVLVPGLMVNAGLMNASISELNATCTNKTPIKQGQAIGWAKERALDIDYNTVQYFPATYLPGTIGIEVGRIIGQRPLRALFTGRIFMLLAYVAIGACAIATARFGRPVLMTVLSLPMGLSLGASFNQDGMLVALSALAVALLTLDPDKAPRRRLLFLPVFILLICSKPPYGLLLFAALAPLAAPHRLRRTLMIGLWGVLPLAWVVIMTHISLMPYSLKPYHPGPLWPGDPSIWFHSTDPAAALRVLLAHPLRILTLPADFLVQTWWPVTKWAIGMLGWLSIPLAHWMYWAWGGALVVAALGTVAGRGGDGIAWAPLDAAFVLLLVLVSVFAVELAIYLSWDKVGTATIYGPQGRYYLPFLPFLMLALPRFGGWLGNRFGAIVPQMVDVITALPTIAMAAYDVVYLPALMHSHFCLG